MKARVRVWDLPTRLCHWALVAAVIVVNFLVDLAYAAVDPRLRTRA